MFDILQITAQYSNAVLVAIMPHVSDFAAKLDVPIIKPVTASQVREFRCSERSDQIGGRVILTNGYEFSFLDGHVAAFRSPKSYFSLQDPDLIPKFYGEVRLNESQAIEVARNAVKKLGYSSDKLSTDKKPVVISPPNDEGHKIPRYRIRWNDPESRDPSRPHRAIEFEVNATTGVIEMLVAVHPSTFRPQPKVDVKPPIIGHSAQTELIGGTKLERFSAAYSNAFLKAVLPQCEEYIRKSGFELKLPLTTNDIDWSRYECGILAGDPIATIDLKSKDRFMYAHGQVVGFFCHDVANMPGEDAKMPPPSSYGPINMTTNEIVALIRKTVTQLGYGLKDVHMDVAPEVGMPKNNGQRSYSRCFVKWRERKGEEETIWASAEVDVTAKKLKYLYIDDRNNAKIWRKPPIGIEGAAVDASPSANLKTK